MINRFVNLSFVLEYVVSAHSFVTSSSLLSISSVSMTFRIFCRCFNKSSLSSSSRFFLRMITWRNFWGSLITISLTISFITSCDDWLSELRDAALSSCFGVSLKGMTMIDEIIVAKIFSLVFDLTLSCEVDCVSKMRDRKKIAIHDIATCRNFFVVRMILSTKTLSSAWSSSWSSIEIALFELKLSKNVKSIDFVEIDDILANFLMKLMMFIVEFSLSDFSTDRFVESTFSIRTEKFKLSLPHFCSSGNTTLWCLIRSRFDAHIKYWVSVSSIYSRNTQNLFLFMNLFFRSLVNDFEFTKVKHLQSQTRKWSIDDFISMNVSMRVIGFPFIIKSMSTRFRI